MEAHENAGADLDLDLDDVGIEMETPPRTMSPVPKILIQQPSMDVPLDEPIQLKLPTPRPEIPPVPEISTELPIENPNLAIISPRPEPQLEKKMRRKFLNSVLNFSNNLGSAFERMGAKSAKISLLRKAHRLSSGGLFAERVRGISCSQKRVGSENQFSLRVFYPKPSSKDSAVKHPVLFYIHGNLAFASSRSYHSFTANLAKNLLETETILISFDFAPVPEQHFLRILDDCVNLVEAIQMGEHDSDFEVLDGLKLDHEKMVIAGDSDGALLAFSCALELAHRLDLDRPSLHGLLLICPPLQALTTRLFESHVKFESINCPFNSHRLDLSLPLYAGLKKKNELQLTTSAIRAERHVASDLRARLLRRIFPTYESASSGTGDNNEPTGIFQDISQLASSTKIWPMLMKNKELALLPMTMMQACENDTLFDEQRLFAKRLHKVLGHRFRFSVLPNAVHNEAVHFKLLKTKASNIGYRELVNFLLETIKKPPGERETTATNNSLSPENSLPEGLETI